jgi:hypothetical protein
LDTAEATLCQICDSQTYVRTIHKLKVHGPSEIIIASTATSPKSKLLSIIEETADDMGSKITLVDRHYWAESIGYEYIQSQAFKEDIEAIKASLAGNYYAVCCIAAVGFFFSKRVELKKLPSGFEIHRVWLGDTFLIPHTQDQVRSIRRIYGGRCFHYPFSRTRPELAEREIERLFIRTPEPDTNTNGCPSLAKQHSAAAH